VCVCVCVCCRRASNVKMVEIMEVGCQYPNGVASSQIVGTPVLSSFLHHKT